MSREKLRLIAALVDAETRSPSPHSPSVLDALDRLTALLEPQVSGTWRGERGLVRALSGMHAALAKPWTVGQLARLAGMSRATFARRFAATFHMPPRRYLYLARMQQAQSLLETTDDTLAAVAALVGYESEFAFSRAFKRRYGVAPGHYRRAPRTVACLAFQSFSLAA